MKKTTALTAVLLVSLLSSSMTFSFGIDTKAMKDQLKEQAKINFEVMNDPEIIKAAARHHKLTYDALIKEGFSKDQAMEIILASIKSNSK